MHVQSYCFLLIINPIAFSDIPVAVAVVGTQAPYDEEKRAYINVNCIKYIEDITRWREDMDFIFEWQNNILRTSTASE